MNNEFGKVAVLYGGTSSEREVSLSSGAAVHEALVTSGVDAHLLDTRDHQALFNLKGQGFARAFIVLHGRGGGRRAGAGDTRLAGHPLHRVPACLPARWRWTKY